MREGHAVTQEERAAAVGPTARRVPIAAVLRWAVVAVLVAGPLVVAVVAQAQPRWYPSLELAQTEIHVRDVGTDQAPRTGLVGRLGADGRASHPGPLSYYALAPVYRATGSTSWSLLAAAAVVHLVAAAVALALAHRVGGPRLTVLVVAGLVVLVRFLGPVILTEPWNPYLPLLCWLAFLFAVWAILAGAPRALPVAAVAGSLCVQTHVSYGVTVALMGLVVLGTTVVRIVRGERPERRRLLIWSGVATGMAALAWLPPVLEDIGPADGNLTVLRDYFTDPPTDTVGIGAALVQMSRHLDPGVLLATSVDATSVAGDGWSPGGLVLLGVWALCAGGATRLAHPSLHRLHLVVGLVLVGGVLATSRIVGDLWEWLFLWSWPVTVLVLVAVAWTLFETAAASPGRLTSRRVAWGGAVVAALVVVTLGRATADAAGAEPNDPMASAALTGLAPPLLDVLEGRDGDDRYAVVWDDSVGVVGTSLGYGMVDELDRHGHEVWMPRRERLRAAPHLTRGRPDATVQLAVGGGAVAYWLDHPDALLVALVDTRSAAERSAAEVDRQRVQLALAEAGHTDIADLVDFSLFGAYLRAGEESSVHHLQPALLAIIEAGHPSAVFLLDDPPD